MFSQIRQAAENIAPRVSQTEDEPPDSGQRSRSPQDSYTPRRSVPLSSSQLAESALANLRKSVQRSGSPRPFSPKSPQGDVSPDSKIRSHSKPRLEERFRAMLASSETSTVVMPVAVVPAQPIVLSQSPTSSPEHEEPVAKPIPSATVTLAQHTLSPLETGSVTDPLQAEPIITGEVATESCAPAPASPLPEEPVTESGETLALGDHPSLDSNHADTDVNALQERLRLVEQRFSDVSTSFKRLQAQIASADAIVREFTPIESIKDVDRLRDYLHNLTVKTEISQDEIQRLNGKLKRQEERIEELRDTHRLESKSQSDQIDSLRRQATETDAILAATQNSLSQNQNDLTKRLANIDHLQAVVERSQNLAKEEEEKRVKAISLLKTVRQKLVKAEKEREDSLRELARLKEKDAGAEEREQAEISKLQQEINAVNAEREMALIGLRAQFDREVANIKEQSNKEISSLRQQFVLEATASKDTHTKELAAKNSQISVLEHSINTLSDDNNAYFNDLQLRQAELESSRTHLDSLQSQNAEMQYRLRESQDRIKLLNEELVEVQRDHANKTHDAMTSAEDVARLLFAVEAKYEPKLADLRRNISSVEKERVDGEAEWSRKLREKTREIENLKRILELSSETKRQQEETDADLEEEIQRLKNELELCRDQLSARQIQDDKIKELEISAEAQSLELTENVASLERQIDVFKARETQWRTQNGTLREELRKVQTSAALVERQRHPGVGYWTSLPDNNSPNSRTSTSSDSPSRTDSPRPDTPSLLKDEDINFEYLRNVILQFLEHKEMRPNLVRVLSIILRFTPQETRRLISKV